MKAPSLGQIVLCCHLVGTADLLDFPLLCINLPSVFFWGLIIPQVSLILHLALVGG